MFKFIYWLFSVSLFYTAGYDAPSVKNVTLTENWDNSGVYFSKSLRDSITAHWDTVTFFAPTAIPDVTTLGVNTWVGSASRIDSFKVYINGTFQSKKLCKTSEALGVYAYTFNSKNQGTLNRFQFLYHVKSGGSGATAVYLRPKNIIQ